MEEGPDDDVAPQVSDDAAGDDSAPHKSKYERPARTGREPGMATIFLNVGRVAVEKNLEAFLELDLPGSKVMLCGFGGGLSWGAALLDW